MLNGISTSVRQAGYGVYDGINNWFTAELSI